MRYYTKLPRMNSPRDRFTPTGTKILMKRAAAHERERCANILTFAAHLPGVSPEEREHLSEICAAVLGKLNVDWAVSDEPA